MKKIILLLMVFLCSILNAQEISIETFATGFIKPVNIKNAGDTRLFVLEQAGRIKIVNSDGSVNATSFLDINPIVSNGGGERGLLGLAFHPNYATNGYFYVNYVNNSGNTVISRFNRTADNPSLADANSELQLLTYTQPYSNHNGGDMAFGPDGYLYISSGDGGNSGDPGDRAQSTTTLLGKLLRLDVDNTSNGNNYAIPPSNPFFGNTTAMQEIWAYGLRNPWKFSFDRTTNELWIADVGQNNIEEINVVSTEASGLNYGWRCYEGNVAYNQTGNCPEASTLTFPVAQYTHGGSRCSITGGYRYHGTAQPNLEGLYFFADYCSNQIGILKQTGTTFSYTFSEVYADNGWTTFGEDSSGEIYIGGITSGTIYKIVDANLGIEENESFKVSMYPNPVTNMLTIKMENPTIRLKSVSIYSVQGALVSTIKDLEPSEVTISTQNISSGLYFVKIYDTNGNSTIKKLIKN